MDYNKLTKQELIELLENSISIEKYNKLESNYKLKTKAFDDAHRVSKELKTTFHSIEQDYQSQLQKLQNDYNSISSELNYMSTILNRQYELTQLLDDRRKQDNDTLSNIIELYHKSIFATEQKK